MKRWDFSRCALTSCVVVVLLTGCGAAQPQIAGSGATPQSRTIATHAGRGRSWMLPEARKGDLLYVSSPGQGMVYVFTYPGGQPDGMLTNIPYPYGLCSDKHGNVFVVSWSSESGPGSILEYAHGGSKPIATLTDGDNMPAQCSVDPIPVIRGQFEFQYSGLDECSRLPEILFDSRAHQGKLDDHVRRQGKPLFRQFAISQGTSVAPQGGARRSPLLRSKQWSLSV